LRTTARQNLPNQNVKAGEGSGFLQRSFSIVGLGLITGAADDGPSGISTYSVAGAAYGYATLWIALFTFPLMAAVQLIAGINAVKMLFWSAVINGLLTPPLILLVILLTCDTKVMGKHVNSPLLRYLGWATFVVMVAAAIGMVVTS
jgi:Mn2+/Fe2+ NRAMP family transporter